MCKCSPDPGRKTLRCLHRSQYIPWRCEERNEPQTNVVPPILWLGDETFTKGIRARDFELVQHSRSNTHIEFLEAEGGMAEVVDNIAEPTRTHERVNGRWNE